MVENQECQLRNKNRQTERQTTRKSLIGFSEHMILCRQTSVTINTLALLDTRLLSQAIFANLS